MIPNKGHLLAESSHRRMILTEPVPLKLCSLIIFDRHLKINKARTLLCENTIQDETMTAPSNDITPHLWLTLCTSSA